MKDNQSGLAEAITLWFYAADAGKLERPHWEDIQTEKIMGESNWGIENSMHWVLDVAFREDDCRIRIGDVAQNLAILRRIALNRLKSDTTVKLGVANKRLKAG